MPLARLGMFTLDWLETPELRRQATAELNKGEARNALACAVCSTALVACVIAP
jgi:TnpA family transposase